MPKGGAGEPYPHSLTVPARGGQSSGAVENSPTARPRVGRSGGPVEPSPSARPETVLVRAGEPGMQGGAEEPASVEGAEEPASRYVDRVGSLPPLALDLFCGTKSLTNRLTELGYRVVSVDNRTATEPTFCVDILTWRYWEFFRPGEFEVIGASPPCTEYSQAKTIMTRDLEGTDLLVKKAFEIIAYFNPKFWWVENPRSGLLKERGWSVVSNFWTSSIANFRSGDTKNPPDFGHVK